MAGRKKATPAAAAVAPGGVNVRKEAAEKDAPKLGAEDALRRELRTPVVRAFVPVEMLNDERLRAVSARPCGAGFLSDGFRSQPVWVPIGKQRHVGRLACADASIHAVPPHTGGLAVPVVLFADDTIRWVASSDVRVSENVLSDGKLTDAEEARLRSWVALCKEKDMVRHMEAPPGCLTVWCYSDETLDQARLAAAAIDNERVTVYASPVFGSETDPSWPNKRGIFLRVLDAFLSHNEVKVSLAEEKVPDSITNVLRRCGLMEVDASLFRFPTDTGARLMASLLQMAYVGWCNAGKNDKALYVSRIIEIVGKLRDAEQQAGHRAPVAPKVQPVVAAPLTPVVAAAVAVAARVADVPPSGKWVVSRRPAGSDPSMAPLPAFPDDTVLHRKLVGLRLFEAPLPTEPPLKEWALLSQLVDEALKVADLRHELTGDVKTLIESLKTCGWPISQMPDNLMAWRFESEVFGLLARLREGPFDPRPTLGQVTAVLRNANACLYVRKLVEALVRCGVPADRDRVARYCSFDLVRTPKRKFPAVLQAVTNALRAINVQGLKYDGIYEIVSRKDPQPLRASDCLWLWHRVRRSELMSLLWNGPTFLEQVSPGLWGPGLYLGDDLSERLGDADPDEREFMLLARVDLSPNRQMLCQMVDSMKPEGEELTNLWGDSKILLARGRYGLIPGTHPFEKDEPGWNLVGDVLFTQLASVVRSSEYVVRDPSMVQFKLLLEFSHDTEEEKGNGAVPAAPFTVAPVAAAKPVEAKKEAPKKPAAAAAVVAAAAVAGEKKQTVERKDVADSSKGLAAAEEGKKKKASAEQLKGDPKAPAVTAPKVSAQEKKKQKEEEEKEEKKRKLEEKKESFKKELEETAKAKKDKEAREEGDEQGARKQRKVEDASKPAWAQKRASGEASDAKAIIAAAVVAPPPVVAVTTPAPAVISPPKAAAVASPAVNAPLANIPSLASLLTRVVTPPKSPADAPRSPQQQSTRPRTLPLKLPSPPTVALVPQKKTQASAFVNRVPHHDDRPARSLPPMPAPPLPSQPQMPIVLPQLSRSVSGNAATPTPGLGSNSNSGGSRDLSKLRQALNQVKQTQANTGFESPPREGDQAGPEEEVDYGDLLATGVTSATLFADPASLPATLLAQPVPEPAAAVASRGSKAVSSERRSRSRERDRDKERAKERGKERDNERGRGRDEHRDHRRRSRSPVSRHSSRSPSRGGEKRGRHSPRGEESQRRHRDREDRRE
jgi:hypothetical protein